MFALDATCSLRYHYCDCETSEFKRNCGITIITNMFQNIAILLVNIHLINILKDKLYCHYESKNINQSILSMNLITEIVVTC